MPRKGRAGPSEHQIQSQILDWLKVKRYFHWRNNSGGFGGQHNGKRWFVKFGKPGSPDIFVIRGGKIIGIEVKANSNYQSQSQYEFETEFKAAGGVYLLAYSLQDVTRVLDA